MGSENSKKIFLAGHNGMVGSALLNYLSRITDVEILTAEKKNLNLLDQESVNKFFKSNKFDEVYIAAARVGGIYANNTFPANFIYENLMIQCNLIQAAHNSDINKLLFLGSSCIYPKIVEQPMTEDSLLSSKLESTNEPYAVAKIAGIKLCESFNRQYGRDYRSVMPTNLYGPNDNFHPKNSHVIPGLIRRFHDAKINNIDSVSVWGSGSPKREFLYVDDMAKGCIHIMNLDQKTLDESVSKTQSHINIGSGNEISIKNLVNLIADIIEYNGEIYFDKRMPDGTSRKLLSVDLVNKLGWSSSIELNNGLKETYKWFIEHKDSYRS
jgi:GDP-L-fucose synthase